MSSSSSSRQASSSFLAHFKLRNLIRMATAVVGKVIPDEFDWMRINGSTDLQTQVEAFQSVGTVRHWEDVITIKMGLYKAAETWGNGHEWLALEINEKSSNKYICTWLMERVTGVTGDTNTAPDQRVALPWDEIVKASEAYSAKERSSNEMPSDEKLLSPSTPSTPSAPSTSSNNLGPRSVASSNEVATSSSLISCSSLNIPKEGMDLVRGIFDKKTVLKIKKMPEDSPYIFLHFDKPVNPFQIMILASCVKDAAPKYQLLTSNCYFFARVVFILCRELFGGREDELQTGAGTMCGGWTLPYFNTMDFKLNLATVKQKYLEKWQNHVLHVCFSILRHKKFT